MITNPYEINEDSEQVSDCHGKPTYETVKFLCPGCRQTAYFGASGLCQHCLEQCSSAEDCGGG